MKSNEQVERRISELSGQRCVYFDYRRVCLDNGDHHGVQDASSDLREIEAQLEILKWVLE